jgi:hypothetical protein
MAAVAVVGGVEHDFDARMAFSTHIYPGGHLTTLTLGGLDQHGAHSRQ